MKHATQGNSNTSAASLRSLLEDGAAGALADGDLLARFAARRGDSAEAAFAALVERHGPMVLHACRAILRDPHAAQDACQATFLLLARRAGSLWVRDSIAPWLHAVACRVAKGARAAEGRRLALERRAWDRAAKGVEPRGLDDLGRALHEEIDRLPDRLKAPVVLCHLEGLTHDQAADHLACPVGTVRSRLSRGRDRLRRGLTRRGFAPPTQPEGGRPAPLPPSFAILTVRAAGLALDRPASGAVALWLSHLSFGAIQAMTNHPFRSAALFLAGSAAVAAGLGFTPGQDPKLADIPPKAAELPAAPPSDDSRFAAIERRLDAIERRLAESASSRRADAIAADPPGWVKIRPIFDDVLVEKVFVSRDQAVKAGDQLLLLRSPQLGVARNGCRTSFIEWDRARKILAASEPLAKDGRISKTVWLERQADEKKSRLAYEFAREKLLTWGMLATQIDGLVRDLADVEKLGPANPDPKDGSRITVCSPIDGVVVDLQVEPGNFYDRKNVLLQIARPKP